MRKRPRIVTLSAKTASHSGRFERTWALNARAVALMAAMAVLVFATSSRVTSSTTRSGRRAIALHRLVGFLGQVSSRVGAHIAFASSRTSCGRFASDAHGGAAGLATTMFACFARCNYVVFEWAEPTVLTEFASSASRPDRGHVMLSTALMEALVRAGYPHGRGSLGREAHCERVLISSSSSPW